MTEEVLKLANEIQREIERVEELLHKVQIYDDKEVTIRIVEGRGLNKETEVVIDEFPQWRYNKTLCAAIEETLQNYRQDLLKDFAALSGNETPEKVEKIKSEKPTTLARRVWNKWHKFG